MRINPLPHQTESNWIDTQDGSVQIGQLSTNLISRKAFKDGVEIQLSAREFDLLALLMAHAGQAVSRDALINGIWGSDWGGDSRTLQVHIRWLRLKIEDNPAVPHYVKTVRGYGYRFIGATERD